MLNVHLHRWSFFSLRGISCAALLLLCLGSTGCVRRRMTIRSFPPGAQVFVDNQEIGTTPCSTSYTYYAKRNIMVVKDGYETKTFVHQFTVPWYEYVPLDFINENLNPNEIRDESTIDVTLTPQENVPPEKLLDRANSMRGGARLGIITPLPDIKPGTVLPQIGVPGQGLPGGEPIPYQSLPVPPLPNSGAPIGPPPLPNAAPPNFGLPSAVPPISAPPSAGPPTFGLPGANPGVLGPPASTLPPFAPPRP
jgi:hypothetical protein